MVNTSRTFGEALTITRTMPDRFAAVRADTNVSITEEVMKATLAKLILTLSSPDASALRIASNTSIVVYARRFGLSW
jgi:hypothetical protein